MHGDTFYMNFYLSILQFRDKRITENLCQKKH